MEEPLKLRVRLFASLRDRYGSPEIEVELPPGGTVADLLEVLEVGAGGPAVAVAVNRRYARGDLPLRPEDEVALIPPVAGG